MPTCWLNYFRQKISQTRGITLLLSSLLPDNSISIDKRTYTALSDAVSSVKEGARLSLTAIGRKLGEDANVIEKYCIKRVDRLLGNIQLHQCRNQFYKTLASHFSSQEFLPIIVDWSSVYDFSFVLLRASVAFQGRAFTLYEEVHPEGAMNNHKRHVDFLNNLKQILPSDCTPIICTDAGFKVPWFKAIEQLDWYWLARTRGTVKCQTDKRPQWTLVDGYHHQATTKPMELSGLRLSKQQQWPCRGVLYKSPRPTKKKSKPVKRPNCNNYKKCSKANREPWFLVSNLPKGEFPPLALVNIYKRRMTIEEAFRDTKNEYYGLGLKRSRSQSIERLQTLLLIALLAQWCLYVIGKAAEMQGYHRHFQSNTITTRRVLSYCYLAKRILKTSRYEITERMLFEALDLLLLETKC